MRGCANSGCERETARGCPADSNSVSSAFERTSRQLSRLVLRGAGNAVALFPLARAFQEPRRAQNA